MAGLVLHVLVNRYRGATREFEPLQSCLRRLKRARRRGFYFPSISFLRIGRRVCFRWRSDVCNFRFSPICHLGLDGWVQVFVSPRIFRVVSRSPLSLLQYLMSQENEKEMGKQKSSYWYNWLHLGLFICTIHRFYMHLSEKVYEMQQIMLNYFFYKMQLPQLKSNAPFFPQVGFACLSERWEIGLRNQSRLPPGPHHFR